MLYFFEKYVLDTERRELRCGAGSIAVQPQVFDLLEYLIRNRERVVSKDDMIAEIWRGRIVSELALTTRINAARTAIGDSGAAQRLIKTLPRKGIRFMAGVREQQASQADSAAAAQPALPLPDKPSIAVLPFQNMSGDPEQDYFADGVVEEIITALSRFRQLFVIARNSSFTYKGRLVDVKQVGRELGVRYLLEGSVRKAATRVRITVQLIDALTGAHLSADRFEGRLKNIFDLQDQVTESVIGVIAPRLEQAEIERVKRKPTESLTAYDYYLRATAYIHQHTQDGSGEALRLLNKAIELDTDFSSAYGMAAWCYVIRRGNRWMADGVKEASEAARLAYRAAALGREDAIALSSGGYALSVIVGKPDEGIVFIDRALAMNPNLAWAWYFSGRTRLILGEPELAMEHLRHAMRLNPLDPLLFMPQSGLALAYFLLGRYDEASSWAGDALRENPTHHPSLRFLAASSALAGRLGDARKAVARLREIDPDLRLSDLGALFLYRVPGAFEKYVEGLRRAGLPD